MTTNGKWNIAKKKKRQQHTQNSEGRVSLGARSVPWSQALLRGCQRRQVLAGRRSCGKQWTRIQK